MSADRDYSTRTRRRRLVQLAVVALVVLGFVGFRIASGSAVKRHLAEMRRQGLPTTALELDAWYKRLPASSNAALVILEAVSEHVAPPKAKDPDEWKGRIVPGQPLPPDLSEMIAAYVGKNAMTLERLDEATELAGSRYPIDLTQGVATLLPHLARVKDLAQFVKWAAIYQSAQGKPEEAVRTLRSGFALAASLEPEPILISELVRIACLTIVLQGLERVISEHQLSQEQLAPLSASLRTAEEKGRPTLSHALAGERAFGIPLFNLSYREYANLGNLGGMNSDGDLEVLKAGFYTLRRAVGLQNRDLGFYLGIMGGLDRALQLDYPNMLTAVEEVTGEMDKELGRHRLKYMVSGMLLPSLMQAAKKEALLAARLRCAHAALAIETYRARHNGKLPRLDELIPGLLAEMPRDPIDNSALEYELNPSKGYRILAATATELANEGRKPTNRQDTAFVVAR
jgi:hypothetical protein